MLYCTFDYSGMKNGFTIRHVFSPPEQKKEIYHIQRVMEFVDHLSRKKRVKFPAAVFPPLAENSCG